MEITQDPNLPTRFTVKVASGARLWAEHLLYRYGLRSKPEAIPIYCYSALQRHDETLPLYNWLDERQIKCVIDLRWQLPAPRFRNAHASIDCHAFEIIFMEKRDARVFRLTFGDTYIANMDLALVA